MGMNLLQNLIMGLVSGFAELLPISAEAHRAVLRLFFGIESDDAVFLIFVHIACLAALIYGCRNEIHKIRRTRHQLKISSRRRKTPPDVQTVYTIHLLRTATIMMIVLKLFTPKAAVIQNKMNYLALPLLLNGFLLILPSVTRNGNKDSRNMPRLDGFLMGFGAGLSVLPGVSPIGACLSIGISRGVDRRFALNFSYLLMIRVLAVDIVFDVISILAAGAAFSTLGLLFAVLGAILAGLACMLAMKIMDFVVTSEGFSWFAYYSWGFALLCFILFLTV